MWYGFIISPNARPQSCVPLFRPSNDVNRCDHLDEKRPQLGAGPSFQRAKLGSGRDRRLNAPAIPPPILGTLSPHFQAF